MEKRSIDIFQDSHYWLKQPHLVSVMNFFLFLLSHPTATYKTVPDAPSMSNRAIPVKRRINVTSHLEPASSTLQCRYIRVCERQFTHVLSPFWAAMGAV